MPSTWLRAGDPRLTPASARAGAGLAGVLLAAAGAVAVFVTSNGAGSAALIAAGTVLIAVALFANRVESLEGGGFKLQLNAVADKLEEARRAEAAGDVEGAEKLRQEAEVLVAAMQPMAARYEELRRGRPSSWERTNQMSQLIEQARGMAALGFASADAVRELFRSGGDGSRIMALGLMQGNLDAADLQCALEVVRLPRSAFEQWQALALTRELVRRGVQPEDRAAIREAIGVAQANGSLADATDTSRQRIASEISGLLEHGPVG